MANPRQTEILPRLSNSGLVTGAISQGRKVEDQLPTRIRAHSSLHMIIISSLLTSDSVREDIARSCQLFELEYDSLSMILSDDMPDEWSDWRYCTSDLLINREVDESDDHRSRYEAPLEYTAEPSGLSNPISGVGNWVDTWENALGTETKFSLFARDFEARGNLQQSKHCEDTKEGVLRQEFIDELEFIGELGDSLDPFEKLVSSGSSSFEHIGFFGKRLSGWGSTLAAEMENLEKNENIITKEGARSFVFELRKLKQEPKSKASIADRSITHCPLWREGLRGQRLVIYGPFLDKVLTCTKKAIPPNALRSLMALYPLFFAPTARALALDSTKGHDDTSWMQALHSTQQGLLSVSPSSMPPQNITNLTDEQQLWAHPFVNSSIPDQPTSPRALLLATFLSTSAVAVAAQAGKQDIYQAHIICCCTLLAAVASAVMEVQLCDFVFGYLLWGCVAGVAMSWIIHRVSSLGGSEGREMKVGSTERK